MARINIEDKLWTDPRFEYLVFKLGDELKAIGMMVKVMRIAQKYWANNSSLIPMKIWSGLGFDPIIDADLAETRDSGVYLRGSECYFDWLLKSMNGAKLGGQRSVEARIKKYGSANILNSNHSNHEPPPEPGVEPQDEPPHEVSRTLFTPTPTLTQNLNTFPEAATATPALPKKRTRTKLPKEPAKGAATWEAYAKAFEAKHGLPPIRDAKANSACCKLVDNLGTDTAPAVAEFYASQGNSYLMQRKHPLGLLLQDCQKYAIEHAQSLGSNVSRVSGDLANDW